MTKWNGIERRRPQPGDKDGRRSGDQHCSQHAILWDHHEKDKEGYRTQTCGKITSINAEIAKMVPWKIFAFLFTFAVLVGGAGFGFFGTQISKLSDKQQEGIHSIEVSLSTLKENQAVMASEIKSNQMAVINEIEVLKRRQDVLRDANIRNRPDDGRDGRDGKVGRDGRDAVK